MSHMHTYTCLCGQLWDHYQHRVQMFKDIGVRPWRGKPGQMIPHRQWIRERLPATSEGFVCAGDDGFARTWERTDQLGFAAPMEWKTYGAELDVPTAKIFKILSTEPQRIRPAVVIRLVGGNVPEPLMHYPYTAECDLPEQPEVADEVYVNDNPVEGCDLASVILAYTREHPRAA